MRKLNREDDGFLQRLLRALQARHIRPLDLRLLHHDRTFQLRLELLLLRVVTVRVAVALLVLSSADLKAIKHHRDTSTSNSLGTFTVLDGLTLLALL